MMSLPKLFLVLTTGTYQRAVGTVVCNRCPSKVKVAMVRASGGLRPKRWCVSLPTHIWTLIPTNIVVGIYIGEEYSQVGIVKNQVFEMILDAQNRNSVPSYVAFLDGTAPLVGFAAKEQADRNPMNIVYGVR